MLPFEVYRDPARMRERCEDIRRDGKRLGVVTTMGALHDGHLSLLRDARRRCDVLVITIFVNPTQFGPGEDLSVYPRQEEEDLRLARASGADLAFCPADDAMYPPGFQTYVDVRQLSQGMCGASRPGHFTGVATIVTKLFNVVRPHVAVFGEKDYQQLAVIRRLATDLDLGIEIVGAPIVREEDGLAMSSRNRYLSPGERAQAARLSRGLAAAAGRFEGGEREASALALAVREAVDGAPDVTLEYVEVRDADTLVPVDRATGPVVVALAARVGSTRLIDNVVLGRAP